MKDFGIRFFPLIVCVLLFLFTSVGFFLTEGKKEKIYGVLSAASMACAIVQAAIVL